MDHVDISICILGFIMAAVFASALCSNPNPHKFPVCERSKQRQILCWLVKIHSSSKQLFVM